MRKAINVVELPDNLRKTVMKNSPRQIPKRVVILGKVLSLFKGMNRKDAGWVLRKALKQI